MHISPFVLLRQFTFSVDLFSPPNNVQQYHFMQQILFTVHNSFSFPKNVRMFFFFSTIAHPPGPLSKIKCSATKFYFFTRKYAKRNEQVTGDDGNFTHSLTRSPVPSFSCKLSDVMLCYECVSLQ